MPRRTAKKKEDLPRIQGETFAVEDSTPEAEATNIDVVMESVKEVEEAGTVEKEEFEKNDEAINARIFLGEEKVGELYAVGNGPVNIGSLRNDVASTIENDLLGAHQGKDGDMYHPNQGIKFLRNVEFISNKYRLKIT